MTSFAFILGVVPLVWATGAGAGGQRALGTAVFGGMITSTVLAVFFTPVFYLLCQSLSEWWKPWKPAAAPLHTFVVEDDKLAEQPQEKPRKLRAAGSH
jgi:hypothetical protein